MRNRHLQIVAAALLLLLAHVILYSLRALDDNSLVRWSWVFTAADASRIYLAVAAALVLSWLLSRISVPDAYHAPVLAALAFAAAIPFWSEPEIIVDASRYFTQAKHLELYGLAYFLKEWGRGIFAWTDLPLVPLCYGMLFRMFGETRPAIQAFTTLLFAGTAVLTYRIGRTLWDRETGFSAGLLLLGIPYLLTQVPLMLVDVPTMFLLALALSAFLEAVIRGGRARALGAVVAVFLFIFSKYSAWFMLSALGVALMVCSTERFGSGGRSRLLKGGGILLAAGACALAVLFAYYDVIAGQIQLLKEYQQPGLARWSESHISTFLFQVHPFIALSALVSAVIAFRRRDWSYMIVAWLVVLIMVFDIRRIRYVLPVFPLVVLLAAYGLQALNRAELRRFVVIAIASISFVIAAGAYLPFAKRMSASNLMRAGAYLDALASQEVTVVTVPSAVSSVNPLVSVALLDLFTVKTLTYRETGGENPRRNEMKSSSLRFTWEFPIPSYYVRPRPSGRADPVVLLVNRETGGAGELAAAGLSGYRLAARFDSSEGVFSYAPVAMVFVRAEAALPD